MERAVKPRGFTLTEVLLAAALGFLLLALLVNTLIPLLHYASWGSARAELVQAAALASERLSSDLQRAPKDGVSLPTLAEPGLVAIHGIIGVTDSGRAIWDSQLVLYEWNSTRRSLTRKLWPAPGETASRPLRSDAPYQLSAPEMRAICNHANGTERRLVQGLIKEFRLEPTDATLHLRMLLELGVSGRNPESYEHVQEVYLRNG